MTEIQLFKI